MSSGRPSENQPGRARRVVDALGLIAAFKAMERRDLDSDDPQFLRESPRIDALAALATRLAKENPRDDECVSELRAAAGRRHRDLRKAAAAVRFGGATRESKSAERANRLLQAAWSGQPVASVSPQLEDLLTRIDDLYAGPVETAWPKLVQLRPELAELDRDFGGRALGQVDKDAIWDELLIALAPIVGPEAESTVTDPLLRSESAHNLARLFLALRAGLIDAVDYD